MKTIKIETPEDLADVFDELISEFTDSLINYQGPHSYTSELDLDNEEDWALADAGCTHVFLRDGNRLIESYIARAEKFILSKFPEADPKFDFTITDPRFYP